MTLSTTASRVNYPGAGSVGPFAIPFRFTSATDLLVTRRSSVGVETTLANVADFTTTGAGNATGTLTLTTALAAGETLSIRRAPPMTQATSIRNHGPYFPATHEDAFDRLVMQIQSLQDQLDRSFGLLESYDPAAITTRLKPETGKALVWQSTTQLGNSALGAASAVAIPGNGRTASGLTEYLLNNQVLNARDFGVVDTVDGDESAAAANVVQMRILTDYAATLTGPEIWIPQAPLGRVFYFGPTAVFSDAAIALPPFTSLRIDGYIKRSANALGRFIGLSFKNTVHGVGTVDGNAVLTAERAAGGHLCMVAGPYALPAGEARPGHFRITGLRWYRSSAMCLNLRGHHIWVLHNEIYNAYGTVKNDADGGVDTRPLSGVNCDGVHLYNVSHAWVERNYIESVDDCIAWTCLNNIAGDTATTDFENINIRFNRGWVKKAENVAAPGLGAGGLNGTLAKIAAGVRIRDEPGFGTGLSLKGVHLEDNEFKGGGYGLYTGTLDLTHLFVRRNRFENVASESATPADYDLNGFFGRVGVITLVGVSDVWVEDNEIDRCGVQPIKIEPSADFPCRRIRIRRNTIRDFDTDYMGIAPTGSSQRAAIIVSSPNTQDVSELWIEDNEGDSVDAAFLYITKNSTGALEKVRVRRNAVTTPNTSGQTDTFSAAFSLRNGTDAANIEILEDRDNRVYNYTPPGAGSATEGVSFTREDVSVLTHIKQWSANVFGAGKFFVAANGAGVLTGTVTTDFNGQDGVLRCQATGANDLVGTAPFSAAPWIGRNMVIEVMMYIVSGTVGINNAQTNVTIAAEATPRWRRYRVVFGPNATSAIRVRFIASGAAEWYLGELKAYLVNA